MKKPIVDTRGFEDLMGALEKRAKTFTPEWRMSRENPDPGTVLASVFAHQVEETIERLNGSLDNYHRAYLNLLNPVPQSGKPAKVPVVFQTSAGYKEKVDLPRGFQLEGSAEGGDRLIYDLEESLHVYPNNVAEAYFVQGEENKIYRGIMEEQQMEIYPENMQKNILYIQTGPLYHLYGASRLKLSLTLNNMTPENYMSALVDEKKCRWSYYSNEEWHPFDVVKFEEGLIILEKHIEGIVEVDENMSEVRLEILEELTFFSHLNIADIRLKSELMSWDDVLEGYRTNEKNHNIGDDKIRPFGERFNRFSSFDLVSNDIFSKSGAVINVSMAISIEDMRGDAVQTPIDWRMIMRKSELARMQPQEVAIYTVDWQYYNGQGWQPLELLEGNPRGFYKHQDGETLDIQFICPMDIKAFEEETKSRYMIRAEIQRVENEHRSDGIFKVPVVTKFQMSYDYNGYQPLSGAWIENGLEKEDCLEKLLQADAYVKAFKVLSETQKAIYIPFENRIDQGVLQLLWTLEFSKYMDFDEPICVEYAVYDGEEIEWKKLKYNDGTMSLSGTGILKLYVDEAIQKSSCFGKEAVWIRIHSPYIDWNNLLGLYTNGVYALQQVRIHNELLDTSSDRREHLLEYEGILELEVWVNELDTLNDGEIQNLIDTGIPCIYEQDAMGHFTECWVRWERTDTLLDKGAMDKVYLYDPLTEILRFGDGRMGKKPPYGRSGLIRLTLTLSAGREGNIEAFKVDGMVASRAFIHSVTNPSPGKGGTPSETVNQVINRQHHQMRSRNRLIDGRDYEAFLMGTFRNLHEVKCLTNTSDGLDVRPGHTVLVVASHDPRTEQVSDEMKKSMLQFISERIPIGMRMSAIHLKDVALLEVSAIIEVEVKNPKDRHVVEKRCKEHLEAFLHHQKGNYGLGWKIGKMPDTSLFYKIAQEVEGIKNVLDVEVAFKYIDGLGERELRYDQMKKLKDYLIVTGKHQIVVK